jgi:8-oxo-dGTP pyrophosphatase MutT (NUDIX family)
MDPQTKPRLASTILPVRDGANGIEVVMLRRNLRSDFVGGFYVFPGGSLDESDTEASWERFVVGVDEAKASSRLGVPRGGLAHYVAALRETFEESGLLVAVTASGHALSPQAPLAAWRDDVLRGAISFSDLLERESLVLDCRHVGYFAHWVTPEGSPRRFDTRFFVVPAPTGQEPSHDESETVASRWATAHGALEAHRRGEFEMILPTVTTLEMVGRFDRVDDLLAEVAALREIPRIQPVMVDGVPVIR